MPLDILYIGFVLGHGGDAAQMLDLASSMAARGRRVRVIVPDLPTTAGLALRGSKRGVDVVRTDLIDADPVAPRQIPERLHRLFQEHPAELIHLHTGDFCLSRTVPRIMGERGIPRHSALVTVHSPYDTLTPDHERAIAWAQAARRRLRFIVCPSRHAVDVQRKYGVPASVLAHIPNGVDAARFACGNAARARSSIGIREDWPLLVFTSRLDPQKRPQDALEVFTRIARDFPMSQLAFVGSGELEDSLHRAAYLAGLSPRVHFAGYRDDVPDWLAAANAWLFPTEAENFSLALLEALSAGCPVVSTQCRGNDEVLVPGRNALTHGVGDIDGMETAVRVLLNDAAFGARISREARRTANRYTLERMTDRYARLYGRMLDSSRASLG